jgi:hypothetical protein
MSNTAVWKASRIDVGAMMARFAAQHAREAVGFADSQAETTPGAEKFNRFAALVGNARTTNAVGNAQLVSTVVALGANAYYTAPYYVLWGPEVVVQPFLSLKQDLSVPATLEASEVTTGWLPGSPGVLAWGLVSAPIPVTGDLTAIPGLLSHSGPVAETAMHVVGRVPSNQAMLEAAALRAFPLAKFAMFEEADPEEGWKRDVLYVRTGIDDVDARMALEDQFYADITGHETTTAALRAVTVVFE